MRLEFKESCSCPILFDGFSGLIVDSFDLFTILDESLKWVGESGLADPEAMWWWPNPLLKFSSAGRGDIFKFSECFLILELWGWGRSRS